MLSTGYTVYYFSTALIFDLKLPTSKTNAIRQAITYSYIHRRKNLHFWRAFLFIYGRLYFVFCFDQEMGILWEFLVAKVSVS